MAAIDYLIVGLVGLCVSLSVRAGVTECSTNSTNAMEVANSWWDEAKRGELLKKYGLSETNFVAACVGDARVVCSIPTSRRDSVSELEHLESLRRSLARIRENPRNDLLMYVYMVSNAFARVQREREAIIREAGRLSVDSFDRDRIIARKREEAECRMNMVLERINSYTADFRSESRNGNVDRAWSAVYAQMRNRGIPETTVEVMRLERELKLARKESFMTGGPHGEANMMIQRDIMEFERWLDQRLDDERISMYKRLRTDTREMPKSRAKNSAPIKSIPEIKISSNSPSFVMFVLLGVMVVVGIWFCLWRRLKWLTGVWKRQNAFYQRYEAGLVSRPIHDGICCFCGEKTPGAICDDCAHLLGGLSNLMFALSFLCAAIVFAFVTLRAYWFAWCEENRFIACAIGAGAGIVVFLVLRFIRRIIMARFVRRRLAFRNNIEFELAACENLPYQTYHRKL